MRTALIKDRTVSCAKGGRGRQRAGRNQSRLKAATARAGGVCLPNSLVKDTLEVALSQGGTLNVFVDDFVGLVDLLDVVEHVLVLDRLHVLLGQGGSGSRVIAKIDLGTDEDDGSSRRVVGDLGEPLGYRQMYSSCRSTKKQNGEGRHIIPLRQRYRKKAGSRRRNR